MKARIAFISDHASPLAVLGGVDSGGQNVYVAETARQLARLGYEVDVFTRWEDASLSRIVNWEPSVRVIHINAGPVSIIPKEDLLPFMNEFTRNMISFIRNEEQIYSLVHAHFFMSALVAADVKQQLAIPFAVTFHALGQIRKIHQGSCDRFPAERMDIEARVVKEADKIIAECPQDKDDLVKYYEADPAKISIVPCGFSPSEFSPVGRQEARRFIGVNESDKILLQLGRMVPRKGVDNVVASMVYLQQLAPTCKLVIVGGETDTPDVTSTPEIGRLQQLAKELGVLDRIIFSGRKGRDVLKYYYSAADIFITTPWYEPFGITPLEAMACGTPVVGSDVGGIKYSVMDGKTGFLVPPRDPRALAAKVGFLLSNPDLLQRMSDYSRKRVNALFTWKKVANMLSVIYEEIMESTVDSKAGVSLKKKSQAA